MANRKSNSDLRMYVANQMNALQDAHSRIVADLKKIAYGTKEFDDMVKLLARIYQAKIEVLEGILLEL